MEAVPCGRLFDTFGEQIIQLSRIDSPWRGFFSPKALTKNVRRTQIPLIINNL